MKTFSQLVNDSTPQLDEGMQRNEQEVYDAMSKVSGYLQEIGRDDLSTKIGKIAKLVRTSKNQHDVTAKAKSI